MTESHTHDDSAWSMPKLDWAPEGDPTVSSRLLAAAKDQCQECLRGLTTEAAQNGDTLAIVVMLAETLLMQPEAARFVPAPALWDVLDRISRMGNPDRTKVVDMLRGYSDERRRAVAAGCSQAVQDYITGVREWADAVVLKRRQRPWWLRGGK